MAEVLGIVAASVQLAELSGSILKACYRFIGKVKNAANDVDQTIREVGLLFALVGDLEAVVKSDKLQGSRLGRLTEKHGPVTICLSLLRELELELSIAIGSGAQMTVRDKLKWPFDSKKITGTLNTISKQRELIECALAGDTNAIVREIKTSQEQAKLEEEIAKRRKERDKVLNWLGHGDPASRHRASRKLCLEGTNKWILESAEFKRWKNAVGEMFWIHAIPGAGKTILCSTVIDHLQEICKSEGTRMAFFYCVFDDAATHKLGYLLRSLITQLLERDPDLPGPLRLLYESCESGRKQPDDKTLVSTLFAILNDGPKSFLVVDALDEFPIEERKMFLDLIKENMGTGTQLDQYNIFFTSRKESDIERAVESIKGTVETHIVPILAQDNDADVRYYIRTSLYDSEGWLCKHLPDDLRREIEDTLANGAEGMFMWVKCQLETLQKCRQIGAMRKALKTLPKTLNGTYERILESISEQDWQIARSALMLLASSFRPITVEELAEAAVIDLTNQIFDAEEQRLSRCDDVLDTCSSLVTVSTHTSSNEVEVQIVQLAHFSVKEYLLSGEVGTESGVSRFCFSGKIAHKSIADMSLIYLLDFNHGERLKDVGGINQFPFIAYASQFWVRHWQEFKADREGHDSGKMNSVGTLWERFFDSEEPSSYINALQICDPDQDIRYSLSAFGIEPHGSLSDYPAPGYYAARMGDPGICEWLFRSGRWDLNTIGGTLGQAIQASSLLGHEAVVKFLLKNGAEVNTVSGKWKRHGTTASGLCYNSSLVAAVLRGHEEMVELLLDRGAQNKLDLRDCDMALAVACRDSRLSLVRMLLERGAGRPEGLALEAAVESGNLQPIELLPDHGADINGGGGEDSSPLLAAATSSLDLDVVRLPFRWSGKVNLAGKYGTALEFACKCRGDRQVRVEMVKLLLEHGADVNIIGEVGVGPLTTAVQQNDAELVTVLLDRGVDSFQINLALHATIKYERTEAARIVIERSPEISDAVVVAALHHGLTDLLPWSTGSIDVNAQTENGTALQAAIRGKNVGAVNLLLKGPLLDINALGGKDGGTALHDAIKQQDLELVTLLLDRGADINLRGDMEPCLALAARTGNLQMMKLLTGRGADVNAHKLEADYPTALIAACRKGAKDIIQFLLDQKADINAWDPGHGDALQVAARYCSKDIVELLLMKGANVQALPGQYGTCLEAVISDGDPETFQLLLDAGANVNRCCRPQNGRFTEGPLNKAIEKRRMDWVALLIERGAEINPPATGQDEPKTPLSQAVAKRRADMVDFLLSKGANVNLIGGQHGCPLLYAIDSINKRGYDPTMLQRLLDAGADVNLACGEYGCPLIAAIIKEQTQTVETLLNYGANVNYTYIDSKGHCQTALSAAARHPAILEELLKRGADPRVADSACLVQAAKFGNNDAISTFIQLGADPVCQMGIPGYALQAAAKRGHIATCRLLLDSGVDVNTFGGKHGNALMAALSMGSYMRNWTMQTVDCLLERGACINSPPSTIATSALQLAIRKNHYKVVTILLERGADINANDPRFGSAATAAASRVSSIPILEKLLKGGVDLSLGSDINGAPLHVAASHANFKAVKLLLDHGADTNQVFDEPGSALHAACITGKSIAVIKLLLERGADINLQGGIHGTALKCAAYKGHLEIVELLLKNGADPYIEAGKYATPILAAEAEIERTKKYHVANFLRRYMTQQAYSNKSLAPKDSPPLPEEVEISQEKTIEAPEDPLLPPDEINTSPEEAAETSTGFPLPVRIEVSEWEAPQDPEDLIPSPDKIEASQEEVIEHPLELLPDDIKVPGGGTIEAPKCLILLPDKLEVGAEEAVEVSSADTRGTSTSSLTTANKTKKRRSLPRKLIPKIKIPWRKSKDTTHETQ
ncbi:hypothetical protein DRE_05444 [Drechslerella stenobrocha 248]|uniref:Uncharacterized protein n=1 Tax=Drechslerella stenobrocha 248 TaxID=1043628 RepID=W7HNH1_9PEZI|nr:hypothetical protein DRE_05444 [Drechslerella stenobrocha 248]